ncbi:hypothetical protein PFFCH_00146 [Plasmodium falciparum FCH/4]|uniref:Uncharacterized protein n=1 Tax=Plasmodium falciparum FCH/4 TaxID=1036724 RepID=A0A024VVU0_PLAFA|nr:hypothetical protein PFFCH_00146 [Plasmodium falciparum FCH/4]
MKEKEVDNLFPGDKDVTNLKQYFEGGDIKFENAELKKEREEIRKNKVFIECVQNIWMNILNKKMDDKFSKVEYFKIMLRICKVLIPQFDIKEIIKIVNDEWINDSEGKKYLNFSSFFNAFFELSDIWTPTINAYDYAHFLKSLFYRITYIEIKTKDGRIIKKKPMIMINFKRTAENKKLSLYNDTNIIEKHVIKEKNKNTLKNLQSFKRSSMQIQNLKKKHFIKRFSENYKLENSFLYDMDDDGDNSLIPKNLFENLLNNKQHNDYLQRNIILMDVNDINPLEHPDEQNQSLNKNKCLTGTNKKEKCKKIKH